MTDWAKLTEPFDDSDVKQRPGAATWEHKPNCEGKRCRETRDPASHLQFSYVDARAVMHRLDDVLTPEGWDFQSEVVPGTEVVHGKLVIGANIREDYGYPNSDSDDEPIKSAASDALKRCAVLFGIGRHLYDDNKSHRTPSRAQVGQSRTGSSSSPAAPPARPAAPLRAVDDLYEFGDDAPEAPRTARGGSDNTDCPIHNVPWVGQWGDLWHKDPDGKYCRHPENTRQEGRRPAGARR